MDLIEIIESIEPFSLYRLYLLSYQDLEFERESFFKQDELDFIKEYTNDFQDERFKVGMRKFWNLINKRCRIKKDIEKLLKKECIFLTLTFDEKHYNIVNKRDRIVRWLNTLKVNYIGNIDFGEFNGREHYHVIVQADQINYSTYKYGAINGRRIVNKNADSLKRYIVKLSNHAVKESTGNSRILKKIKY